MISFEIVNSNQYYKIFDDDKVVGGAWVGKTDIITHSPFMTDKSKVIMNFGINFEFHNKGFGSKLISKIIENEKNVGTDFLRLGVYIGDDIAIKLYKKFGFIDHGSVGLNKNMMYMWKKLN